MKVLEKVYLGALAGLFAGALVLGFGGVLASWLLRWGNGAAPGPPLPGVLAGIVTGAVIGLAAGLLYGLFASGWRAPDWLRGGVVGLGVLVGIGLLVARMPEEAVAWPRSAPLVVGVLALVAILFGWVFLKLERSLERWVGTWIQDG